MVCGRSMFGCRGRVRGASLRYVHWLLPDSMFARFATLRRFRIMAAVRRSGDVSDAARDADRCGSPLGLADEAFICSYECTFCAECAGKLNSHCTNCGDELLQRPKRLNLTCGCSK